MATQDSVRTYDSAAEIVDYWLNNIMPRYFTMENINTYRAGTLGFITDAMATTSEDTIHGMMLARREFYPNTAKYTKSLYRHAAARFMDAPMATPASANVLLLIQQSDIIKYGTWENGLHTFVLDDTFVAHVDDMTFMLDYPITILSAEKSGGRYAHTAHYDFYINNSLSQSNERYLPNRVINGNGTEYLLLQAKMRQVLKTYDNAVVTSNAVVTTVTMDFPFSGQLANFEAFYTENNATARVQLEKRLMDSGMSKKPFCWYTIVDDSTIRLQFPANPYFTPKLNSTISIEIYTTEGAGGNFDKYESDIQSENESTRYPYNAQVPIFGVVDGKSEGGKDIGDLEDFRTKVMRAYATNHTYISSNDLQLHFDELMEGTTDRFKFTPKRDDAFVRLYGAFLLMKDEEGNVVPTNTLDVDLDPIASLGDFDIYSDVLKRYILKPGALFVYRRRQTNDKISYIAQRLHGKKITDDLSEYDTDEGIWVCQNCGHEIVGSTEMDDTMKSNVVSFSCPECGAPKTYFTKDKFVFTNPYLVAVSTDSFMAGYFFNSVADHHDLSYTAVNDQSIVQFIARHFKVERDAIAGENFYRFSVAIAPSTTVNEKTICRTSKEIIAAKYDGVVESILHNGEYVEATIRYTYDPTNRTTTIPEDEVYQKIKLSSTIEKVDDTFRVCPNCGRRITLAEYDELAAGDFKEPVDEDGVQATVACPGCEKIGLSTPTPVEKYEEKYVDYDYHPGYALQFKVGDSFSMGDRLATARPQDLGRLRLVMDLNGIMTKTTHRYIPLTLESQEDNGAIVYYIFSAYISTDDMIDTNHIMEIKDGFVMQDGSSTHASLALPIANISMKLHAFYEYREDDEVEEARSNPTHAYSSFDYVRRYTFTNTYELQTGDSITLVKALDYAKGFLDTMERSEIYKEPEPTDPDDEDKKVNEALGGPGYDPPNEPLEDETPDDPMSRYLRTVEHQRILVVEDQDDRYDERALTVDKYAGGSGTEGDGSGEDTNDPNDPNGDWNQGTTPPVFDESESTQYGDSFFFRLRNTPLVSANWVKKDENSKFLIEKLNYHYKQIEDIVASLDNGFSIDIKFYNTYGKSKFYKVGNGAKTSLTNMDSVNITVRFGVSINYPTGFETFRDSFQRFVQKYIEATDEMVGNGIDLYIMNLMAAAKAEFDEIVYMEYYGINDYDYSAQRMTIMSDTEILKTVRADSFVPEFLNIVRETTTDGTKPRVSVMLINDEDL